MILLVIAIVTLFVGVWLIHFGKKNYNDADIIGTLFTILSIIALFIMIGLAGFKNVFHDRDLAMLESKRDALIYQMNNGLYLGDALGDFNAEIIYHQSLHESPWTNVFVGDCWMEIEPIDVKGENNAA